MVFLHVQVRIFVLWFIDFFFFFPQIPIAVHQVFSSKFMLHFAFNLMSVLSFALYPYNRLFNKCFLVVLFPIKSCKSMW